MIKRTRWKVTLCCAHARCKRTLSVPNHPKATQELLELASIMGWSWELLCDTHAAKAAAETRPEAIAA